MTALRSALLLCLFVCVSARAEDASPPRSSGFESFEEKHAYRCNAPLESLAAPDVREHGGYRYELSGATAKVRRVNARKGPVRFGVLSAIKDAEPETFALLSTFLAEFEKQDVEAILVGGDTADNPAVLDAVYGWLVTKTSRPILTVAGNSERGGAHNYAVQKQRKAGHLHLLNGGLIRRLDLDGADVVTLSGYYDKRFTYMAGACIYKPEDLEAVIVAAQGADDAVVLLSHGPPQQKGKEAIDFVPDYGNVGDPEITRVVTAAKIPFGVHGHILEAGARATDLRGKPLKPGKLFPALFLNPGSANPLPWKLNGGGTSYGLAAVLTVDGKKARYDVLRAPKPKD